MPRSPRQFNGDFWPSVVQMLWRNEHNALTWLPRLDSNQRPSACEAEGEVTSEDVCAGQAGRRVQSMQYERLGGSRSG